MAAAHAKGCYVVGVGFPMTTNRYSPPNYNDHPEHGQHGFEDMCSIFLYDCKSTAVDAPCRVEIDPSCALPAAQEPQAARSLG